MLTPACDAFRRDFTPGEPAPHAERCAECHAWAEEVSSWRTMGARRLPHTLRARLVRIPSKQLGPRSIPHAPLSADLRIRLLRIPAGEQARGRIWKARYVLAASYLLAGLLSLAPLHLPLPTPLSPSPAVAVRKGLSEAGRTGTHLLLRMGGWILDELGQANRSAETLFDRLAPGDDSDAAPEKPSHQKETPDGTRTAP